MQYLWTFFGRQPDLAEWEKKLVAPSVEDGPGPRDHRDAQEREVAVESAGPPESDGPHCRIAAAIFRFDVFPPRLVTPVLRRAPVEMRDTVGVLYHFAPGLKFFFAARVVAVFDEPVDGFWKTGFTYRTLTGHPELGEETFTVEKDLATGRVRVALRSWSRPGIFLTRAFSPLTRTLQLQAGRMALDHLERVAWRPAATLLRTSAGR
jgi:uncharacterized protein (UPF0548 family)